ncbi:hypothetical protein [Olleya sp. R77988]|uniref:hypothetical protein n=1 Tax=Olleya sp. R77988 TaxID=3093875 RepID=UPI0037C6DC04
MKVVIDSFKAFDTTPLLATQKAELLGHFNTISLWATTQSQVFVNNRIKRKGGYGRAEFFEDLNLLQVLNIVNTLFAINNGINGSYLLGVLDSIFKTNNSGVVDQIDDTSWTPTNQVNGKFEIVDVNITDEDPYHKKNKKSNYDGFIDGIEKGVKSNGKEVKNGSGKSSIDLLTNIYVGNFYDVYEGQLRKLPTITKTMVLPETFLYCFSDAINFEFEKQCLKLYENAKKQD